jgi:hypothetical protein
MFSFQDAFVEQKQRSAKQKKIQVKFHLGSPMTSAEKG